MTVVFHKVSTGRVFATSTGVQCSTAAQLLGIFYPLVMTNRAMENDNLYNFIVDFLMKNGDFHSYAELPDGIVTQTKISDICDFSDFSISLVEDGGSIVDTCTWEFAGITA